MAEIIGPTIGLWRDNLSEGFLIQKTTTIVASNIEASVKGIEESAIKEFLITWMLHVTKKDLFTEDEKRKPLTLSEMFDIIKINLF